MKNEQGKKRISYPHRRSIFMAICMCVCVSVDMVTETYGAGCYIYGKYIGKIILLALNYWFTYDK